MLISLSYFQQKVLISQFFENCHRSRRNWEIFLSEDAIIILYNVSYKNHGMKLQFCLDRQNFHQFDTCSVSIQYSSKNEFLTKFLKQEGPTICLLRLCVCPSVCLSVCLSVRLRVCPSVRLCVCLSCLKPKFVRMFGSTFNVLYIYCSSKRDVRKERKILVLVRQFN